MKRIILLSVGFPYGHNEPFLLEELKYHKNTVLVSTFIGDTKKVINNFPKESNCILWHPDTLFFKGNRFARFSSAIKAIFTKEFWVELKSEDIKPIRLCKIKYLLSFLSKANEIYKFVENKILEEGFQNDELVFYSYWMNQLALSSTKLAKRFHGKSITRCHGYDLYKRGKDGYIAMQRKLIEDVDYVFPISNDGKQLLENLIQKRELNKIIVSRLGTSDCRTKIAKKTGDTLKIVSCSNVVPLKRIDCILEAIKQIDSFSIEWIHFGDGSSFDELKKMVERSKTQHTIKLLGRKSNGYIMDYYNSNYVDVFINVSSSEGIPVSIMEALSFGIPCVATNVGGVKEIIKDGYNGYLLDQNFSIDDLVLSIYRMNDLRDFEREKIRTCARTFWEHNYYSQTNYLQFMEKIDDM